MRNPAVSSGWFVYLLLCADGSLYAGITTDVERRVVEHNTDDVLGARYTRCRRPVELAYVEGAGSRSDATRRELALKKLRRREKLALILGSSGLLPKYRKQTTSAVSRN